MIARHAVFYGYIREHAKLLDVGTAHQGKRSAIEANYDHGGAGEFLNSLLELHPWFSAPSNALHGDRERIFDLAGNQLFDDSALRASDRRVRFPLLSQPVMEACLRVPSWMWISGGQNRAIARSAFSGQLPHEVLNRRSKGNFMNYTFAVYRKNMETISRFLLDGHLCSRGLLDPHKLNLFLESPLPARDQSFMRIFDLCMIENWVRNHV